VRFTTIWIATTLASVLGAGCGDDDGSSSGDQTIGELSTSQVATLCKSVQAKMDRLEKAFISVICTDEALFDEDTCSAERKSCIADPPAEATLGDDANLECGADKQESVTTDCPMLTVDQLQGCLEAVVKSFETTAASFTCTSDPDALEEPATPKACRDLKAVCPMLSDFSG
jgi:hypothetical protein